MENPPTPFLMASPPSRLNSSGFDFHPLGVVIPSSARSKILLVLDTGIRCLASRQELDSLEPGGL